MDSLWVKLLEKDVLLRGWHLARLDTRQDFSEDLFSTDVFGLDLISRIRETSNRIKTETYQPRPLLPLEVPKGSLGFRPGSVIPIQDRVVVSAIVLLMAETADNHLPEAVFSWRLKKPVPGNGPIFKEQTFADLPFLKRTTIRNKIDPFLPWYNVWPQFDKSTRETYLDEGYRYLATSDIAAYFENIQLLILRDRLLHIFPNDPKIVNLLFIFLEAWTTKTLDGRVHQRGIPQGNFVSSFLGNIFLLPLDLMFAEFEIKHDAKYFRYMDDVRIFTKNIEDARLSVFKMDRKLKQLHLNIQTAKTKILDHKRGEIAKAFFDDRVDDFVKILKEINKEKKAGKLNTVRFLKKIDDLAKKDTNDQQKIVGARRSLSGLSLRAFLMWINAHNLLNSDKYIDRLLREIDINPEYKLTKKLMRCAKLFPEKNKIQKVLFRFFNSRRNIFPHQEAECLRAVRYLNRTNSDMINHCVYRVLDKKQATYVRMQAAYLLSRNIVDLNILNDIENCFDRDRDPYVQAALSTVMVQKRKHNSELIMKLVFHPNEKICDIGKFYQKIKNDDIYAASRLKYIFESEVKWVLCDNIPVIHLMAASRNVKIRQHLLNAIKIPRLKHPVFGLRDILKDVYTRTKESLRQTYP
jgi:reverse transcriptase-like protein